MSSRNRERKLFQKRGRGRGRGKRRRKGRRGRGRGRGKRKGRRERGRGFQIIDKANNIFIHFKLKEAEGKNTYVSR